MYYSPDLVFKPSLPFICLKCPHECLQGFLAQPVHGQTPYLFISQQIPSFHRSSCLDGTLSFSITHIRTPRRELTSDQQPCVPHVPASTSSMPLSLEAWTISEPLNCLLASILARISGISPLLKLNNHFNLSMMSPWHSRCIQASQASEVWPVLLLLPLPSTSTKMPCV